MPANHQAEADLLEGADEIAEFLKADLGLKVSRRRAFHLCASKQIPAGKLGGKLIGSKRAIRKHFERLTSHPG
jgi:hypothetical protein